MNEEQLRLYKKDAVAWISEAFDPETIKPMHRYRFNNRTKKWEGVGMPQIRKTKAGMQREIEQLNGYWTKSVALNSELDERLRGRDDEIRGLKTRIRETERAHGMTAAALNRKWATVGALEDALVLMAKQLDDKTALALRFEQLYAEELRKGDTLGLAVGSERKVTDRG